MSGSIQHLTQLDDYINLTSTTNCVVKFTAAWCGPCQVLAPKFEELTMQYGGSLAFLEVDVDKAGPIARHMVIRSLPRIMFYLNGERRDDLLVVGCRPDDLVESVMTLYAEVTTPRTPMQHLTEDNLIENDDSEDEDEEAGEETEEETKESSDSDSAHNEYGEDCDLPIEKTIDDLSIDSP